MSFDIIIPSCKTKEDIQNQINEIENNTPEKHRIIATLQPLSAAKNRNYGLSFANSDIIIMLDDDITGFYKGWLTDLICYIQEDDNIILTSARLLDKNSKFNNNMGMHVSINNTYSEILPSFIINNIQYKRVTTACIAFRKSDIKFDEVFKKSGYEDTCFLNQISEQFPGKKFIVNNRCKLIHLNNMLGQNDRSAWQHNHDHYCKKYAWDTIAQNQKPWC